MTVTKSLTPSPTPSPKPVGPILLIDYDGNPASGGNQSQGSGETSGDDQSTCDGQSSGDDQYSVNDQPSGVYFSTDGLNWNEFKDPGDGSLFRTQSPEEEDSNFAVRYVVNGMEFHYGHFDDGTFEANIDSGVASIVKYRGRELNVTIPQTILGCPVKSIGQSAFQYCTTLEDISLPDSVTQIGPHAFYACTALKDLDIPSSVTNIGSSVFAGFYDNINENIFSTKYDYAKMSKAGLENLSTNAVGLIFKEVENLCQKQ